MEASELRIGNYVECEERCGDTVYPLTSIYNDNTICFDQAYHKSTELYKAKPISLTEEWLLKFGFRKDVDLGEKTNYYYLNNRDDSFYVDFDLGGYDEWHIGASNYGYIRGIEYVHQLQNLYFALTGEELKIKEINEIIMRWTEKPRPKDDETRIIKRFLFLPLCIGNEYRWLETVTIKQWWCAGSLEYGVQPEWNNSAWIN